MRELRGCPAPWVLVAGGFHRSGGMDKANLALAECLVDQGIPVHLVSHSVASHLQRHPLVTLHFVPRPCGSFFLGDRLLDYRGRAVARTAVSKYRGARVLVNGGNCRWADLNWVHCVHHAWPCFDRGAPVWFKVKNRAAKRTAKRQERHAIRAARILFANSEKTRRDLVDRLGISPARIHTVYLGSEPTWQPATDSERREARARLSESAQRPLIAFVGALSYDHNKGFDTLWSAWTTLCRKPEWDAKLIVAGFGNGLGRWRSEATTAGLAHRVTFLGFTDEIVQLLAAVDLLVSPVRYEAYGLNVQEAICCGVPAMVSASAGISERFPSDLSEMLLQDAGNVSDLMQKLYQWRVQKDDWKVRFQQFGNTLRRYSWTDMARQIVSIASEALEDQAIKTCLG